MKKTALFLFAVALSIQVSAQPSIINDLKTFTKVLTADSLKGRKSGSEFEKRTADFISRIFTQNGVELLYPAEGQDFSFVSGKGDTIYSRNIVGIVEGYDPVLKNEYIVIGAHYDHLGSYFMNINGKDSLQIFRGADDNASGVACMMGIAKMAAAQKFLFKRSLLFVAFGAEEVGMTGSWYFVNRAFGQISKVDYMVNLDMVGRSGGENFLRAYTVVPDVQQNEIFNRMSENIYKVYPKVFNYDYFPSDHQPFASAGIPVALFTTGLHSDYHTLKDLSDKLDYAQMESVCEYVFDLVRSVSDREKMLRRNVLSADQDSDPAKKIYSMSEVQKRPTFLRGDEKDFLKNWVYKYVKYPEYALKAGIQGRVVLEFVIEKDGSVSQVDVIESVDSSLDDEAVRVVKASPKWKAAIISGKPVRSRVSIPIEFRLKR